MPRAPRKVPQAGQTKRDYGTPDVYKTRIQLNSSNEKVLGKDNPKKLQVTTTARTVSTCPANACPFRVDFHDPDTGEQKQSSICYAHTASNPGGKNPFSRAEAEGSTDTAGMLDQVAKGAKPNSLVRHLESGDLTPDYVDAMKTLHTERPDLRGIVYTHHTDESAPWLKHDAVPGVTINKSTESPEQAAREISRGWQAVIESPHDQSLAGTRIAGRKVVTCPAQTTEGKVGCASCNLCSSNSPTRPVVEFLAHGATKQVGAAIEARRVQDNPNVGAQMDRVLAHDVTPEGKAYSAGRRMATGVDPSKFSPSPPPNASVHLGMPQVRRS